MYLRTRLENISMNTTTKPQRQPMVTVSIAPPVFRRTATALTPAPITMPALMAGGTMVFSFLDKPVAPKMMNSKPNSNCIAVSICNRATPGSSDSRNTTMMAIAGVIQPQMEGSPSSQFRVYMPVSNTTNAQATAGSRPKVVIRTARAPYEVQAFIKPVTTSGGEILK